MNTTTKLMTILLALLLPLNAFALPPTDYDNYEFEVDGIYYKIEGNVACVTYQRYASGMHLSDYHGDVVIPETVTYQDKIYPVTMIGNYAFNYCQGLTSITIPASITSIGYSAFYLCTGLTRVIITDVAAWCRCDIYASDSSPFNYAHHLYLNDTEVTELVIPDDVTAIGKYAFMGCTEITKVTCLATTPPMAVVESFDNECYNNATLFVPAEAIDAYKRNSIWRKFSNIQSIVPDDVPGGEDDYEYVPFVREGVKWVYYYNNDFGPSILDMPEGIQYYSFEMLGDVQIGDKYYKPVHLTHYLDRNDEEGEVEDFVPVYLREEDKVVYAIHPDGIQHPKCPTGIYQCIHYPDHGLPITTTNEEFVLYDFNDPKGFYDTFFEDVNTYLEFEGYGPFVEYVKTDTVPLGNHQSKCHYFNCLYSAENRIIEGVGYDGYVGMPLFYFERLITGLDVRYYLSHVIEDGEIIYKGIYYRPNANGDVNGDGEVTVGDANSVIDVVIMGGNAGHNRIPATDVNGDGEINIGDVNAIIDIILTQNH